MSLLDMNPSGLASLKDKVVLITGGAAGIGREATILFHQHGAKVVVGDVNAEAGKSLATELGDDRFLYRQCDVASYTSQLDLFKAAKSRFGPVDVAVANAAVNVTRDPFVHLEDIDTEPELPEIDINLRGSLFTARLAMHQMKTRSQGGDIVLISSIAGFKETAHITPYVASKHGVLGILRGLRVSTRLEWNIRVNAICPWMTKTSMTSGIAKGWLDLGLPSNESIDVANAMLICATANRASHSDARHPGAVTPFHGKILFVAGGRTYEIEEKIQALEPQWLGEENSRQLARGQAYLHNGTTDWNAQE